MVRIDLVDEQFGDLLKRLQLPENWRGLDDSEILHSFLLLTSFEELNPISPWISDVKARPPW